LGGPSLVNGLLRGENTKHWCTLKPEQPPERPGFFWVKGPGVWGGGKKKGGGPPNTKPPIRKGNLGKQKKGNSCLVQWGGCCLRGKNKHNYRLSRVGVGGGQKGGETPPTPKPQFACEGRPPTTPPVKRVSKRKNIPLGGFWVVLGQKKTQREKKSHTKLFFIWGKRRGTLLGGPPKGTFENPWFVQPKKNRFGEFKKAENPSPCQTVVFSMMEP